MSGGNWRGVVASTIGNVLEWYDFVLFGFLSIIITRMTRLKPALRP